MRLDELRRLRDLLARGGGPEAIFMSLRDRSLQATALQQALAGELRRWLTIADPERFGGNPEAQDLAVVMPLPPQVKERLVFITDVGMGQQCSTCPEQPGISMNAMQDAVLRLYGPEGDNQTSTFRVSSYTLDHLQQMLDGNSPPYIETDLARTDWVILLITDASRGQPALISRFLAEQEQLWKPVVAAAGYAKS